MSGPRLTENGVGISASRRPRGEEGKKQAGGREQRPTDWWDGYGALEKPRSCRAGGRRWRRTEGRGFSQDSHVLNVFIAVVPDHAGWTGPNVNKVLPPYLSGCLDVSPLFKRMSRSVHRYNGIGGRLCRVSSDASTTSPSIHAR